MKRVIEFFVTIFAIAMLIQYWWILLLAAGIFLVIFIIIKAKRSKTSQLKNQANSRTEKHGRQSSIDKDASLHNGSGQDQSVDVEETSSENVEPHYSHPEQLSDEHTSDESVNSNIYTNKLTSIEENKHSELTVSKPAQYIHRLRRKLTDFVVFDIETTGLNRFEDKIIQISAIKYIKDQKVGTFNQYINPGFQIDKKIMFLTGIDNSKLESSPTISTVMPSFELFIEDLPLIGHNIVKFDIPFLINNGFSKQDINALDTYPLSDKKLPDLKNHKLPTLKKYFGIANRSHDALNDCETNAIVYQKLRDNDLNPVTIEYSNLQQILAGKRFCITGEFMEASREDLIDTINKYGGKFTKSVSHVTDYLIDGTQVSTKLTDGVHSSSELKAIQYQKENGRIKIISYDDFCNLLPKQNQYVESIKNVKL
ncbi:hypothetical protein DW673_15200 [Lactiplantibacillus plantarum]|uniref:exonuclease domain-containing protein n=1 Tax=Lactiplantibacillus plantarum TaxID=1590 RepID=UPI000D3007A5|nr:exonuclease domain-containing protein [Lactiplantibacillus plantarum]MBO2714370.1 hypothetical protein [Lactiplantibacillus plantarum]MCG0797273.1 DNA polymerase III subunit epsilon [Lactiplantibacillus plantarum]PTM28724.1 hypothetical protein DA799_14435 [Lactiplantibacillus plantarum]RHF51213.1 hypothetical protein DW673_15200 [Lactiplantibacillus plantarum]